MSNKNIMPKINLDIRIMASPKRKFMAKELCAELNLAQDHIIWDDRPNGGNPRYTAQKAWLYPFDENVTHRMVIQDDAIICDDFLWAVNNCLEFQPDITWTFFMPRTDDKDGYFRNTIPQIAGVCIVMPVQHVINCWQWCDRHMPDCEHDDTCISRWLFETTTLPMTTVPSLCNERGESLLGHNAPRPQFYSKKAAHEKDWNNTTISLLL